MYLEYFGLRQEPFSVTSDPAFLWMGPAHEEAYAHIRYAVLQRKGFALLSGEVGTGKTTLVNQLLNDLDAQFPTCVVFNPVLNLDSLFQYMFRDFGIGTAPKDRGEAISAMYEWLAAEGRSVRSPVIVIDEAQNLPDESLEGLRLLSNFETEQTKLLQILLVGQPELRKRLQSEHLRQIQQRIAIQYHLVGLEPNAVADYVRHRLQIAGAPRPDALFSTKALQRLGDVSNGVPRVINQVADLCLLKAYSQGKLFVDDAVLVSVLSHEFAGRMATFESGKQMVHPLKSTLTVCSNRWRTVWIPSALGLALITGAVGLWVGQRLATVQPESAMFVGNATLQPNSDLPDERQSAARPFAHQPSQAPLLAARLDSAQVRIRELEGRLGNPNYSDHASILERDGSVKITAQDPDASKRIGTVAISELTLDLGKNNRVRIRPNDTLVKIALRVYGRDDWGLIRRICAANPGIADPNVILVGDEIVLPAE